MSRISPYKKPAATLACLPTSRRPPPRLRAAPGFLLVEDCVKAHAEAAVRAGATLQADTVHGWKPDGRSVIVETDDGKLSADRIVITAGAWASDLLASLNVPFQVRRKPLFWYRTNDPSYQIESGCPCFFFESLNGQFYGFPQSNELGVKLAEHTGGGVVTDPLQR